MCSDRNNTMFSSLFPYPLLDPTVVVVSDSEYRRYKQKQAREDILILQSKRNRYTAAIADIDEQIASLEQTATPSATLSSGSDEGVQQQ